MKKYLILSVAAATFFAACNSNPKPETTTVPAIDTTLNVQADKARSVEMNGVSDTVIGSNGEMYIKAKPNAADQSSIVPPVVKNPVKSTVRHHTVKHHSSSGSGNSSGSGSTTGNGGNGSNSGNSGTGSSGSGSGSGTNTDNTTATTTTTTEEPKKKGWSNAAKGAAIGGAGGAVAGAIVSKNKAVGAVVGGLIGAGGGYLFGKKKDKKKQQADSTQQK